MFEVSDHDEVLACTLIYDYGVTVHTQYMYNTDRGFRCVALDFLTDQVIQNIIIKRNFSVLQYQNRWRKKLVGLQRQKEMNGRSVYILHDT